MLEQAKTERILQAKAEAAMRIMTQWPDYAQRSAALGIYDDLPADDPFHPVNMKAGIKAIIEAEHAAEQAIQALEDVEAVNNFTW